MIFPLQLSLSFLRLLEQPATGVVLGMLLEGMEWKIMGVYWMAWAQEFCLTSLALKLSFAVFIVFLGSQMHWVTALGRT